VDLPPIVPVFVLVPAFCVLFGIWLGAESRGKRWGLGLALVTILLCCGFLIRANGSLAADEALWGAAASGNMKRVEEELAKGANPSFRFDSDISCIEVARTNGHEEVARRLERAAERQ
jgi:hypothetical protein